jgi:hypothetical protein
MHTVKSSSRLHKESLKATTLECLFTAAFKCDPADLLRYFVEPTEVKATAKITNGNSH